MRKKRKEDEQPLEELKFGSLPFAAKCQLVQTSYIQYVTRIKLFLVNGLNPGVSVVRIV